MGEERLRSIMVMAIHLLLHPPPPATIIIRLLCFVLICLLPLFCSGSSSSSSLLNVSSCPEHERQALLHMIKYKGGDPSYGDDDGFLTRSWVAGTNCCQWYGIACDRRTGHVVRIDLRHVIDDYDHVPVLKLYNSLLALKHLRYLDLSGNEIYPAGVIPGFIGSFQNLRYLNLSFIYNFGSDLGDVPHQLGNLSRLRTLSLMGTLCQINDPRWLSGLTSLQQIELGEVGLGPGWVEALTMLPSIRVIRVYGGGTGLIPSSLNPLSFTNLSVLDLSGFEIDENLTTVLPSWLSNLTRLRYLRLSNGNLGGGQVVASLNLSFPSSLEVLDLSSNQLQGSIPDTLGGISMLRELDLSGNNFTGSIPQSLGHLSRLKFLDLSRNKFSGSIPQSLGRLSRLEFLDLSRNNLSGSLPQSLGSLSRLVCLALSINSLTGSLTEAHFGNLSSLKHLKILDLSHNNLSGAMPPSFGSFPSMMTLDVLGNISDYDGTSSYFGDRVLLWMKGQEQTYNLFNLVAIDLSHNGLSGTIPEQLASLILLQSLNLSNNHLTGEITTKIGRMQQLESLDLSYNRLSGPIPPSLANLSSLGYLDLSYNNLSGRIPTGGHIDTFQDPSMYRGNPFLDSINVKHGGDTTTEGASVGENTDEGIDEIFWLYNSIAPGFVVGIWAVLGPLLFKKAWRYAYFQAMDTMWDKILCRQS